MRKRLQMLGFLLLSIFAVSSSAQILINEDFTGTTGTIPPTGWANIDSAASGNVWEFDNPGSQTLNAPISNPAAIFDSDNYGGGTEDAFLESPVFDVSNATGSIFLSFDHYFQSGFGGSYEVLVYNGTVWTVVANGAANSTANPASEFIDITAEAGVSANAQIRFRWQGDFSWYWIVDNVKVEVVSCSPPSALGSDNLTTSTGDIYWTSGGASNWNVEYDVTGFALGSGTFVAATNDTLSISSLMDNTTYDFYVQDSCAVGDVSTWTGPVSFTTPCSPLTLPQLEDFTGGIPPTTCWDEATSGTPLTGPTGFGTGSWDAQGFGNVGSSGAAGINIFSTSISDWLISPEYDLSVTTAPQLEFDFGVFLYSAGTTGSAPSILGSDDTVEVFISNDGGTTITSLLVFNNTYITATNGNREVIDLTAYVGDTVMFAIYATSGSTSGGDNDIFIDNFQVREAPACPAPSSLGVTNLTSSSAVIYWIAGGATNWNVEYGFTGFTLGSGTFIAATNDTLSMGSLMENTTYDFYVQDSCAVGDVSTWSGPVSFTTLCGPLALPQLEDFTGGVPPTNCWDEATSGTPLTGPSGFGTGSWGVQGFGNVGSSGAAGINIFSTSISDWLISPEYDLSGATAPQLEFDFGVFLYSGGTTGSAPSTLGSDDTVEVFISNDGGTTITSLLVFNNTYITATNGNREVIDLTAYVGDTVMFAIYATSGSTSGGDNDIFVDNFQVREAPLCLAPSALGATSITSTSADLYWTSGGATNWDVEYGTTGFTPGSGIFINATNDTLSIAALLVNTGYEFYIRDSCAVGNTSAFVGPFAFSTSCLKASLPFTENFDAGFPSCWTTNDAANVTTSTCARSGDALIIFTPNGNFAASQVIDASGQTSIKASWWYREGSGTCGNAPESGDNLNVEYWNGSSWVLLANYDGSNAPSVFTKDSAIISSGITSDFQIRFFMVNGTTTAFDSWSFDDISVEVGPTCPPPSALGSTLITATTADVYWTPGLSSNWNVEYGPVGFTLGTGTLVTSTNDTLSLSSLTPEVTYEFYVQDSCAIGDVSAFTGPGTFTTPPTCPAPSALGATAITVSSADVYWTTGGANNWNVEYGIAGFTLGTGTLVASTNDTLTISALSPQTIYDVYVQDSCAVGDASVFTGPLKITTACVSVSTYPFIEDFETSTNTIPLCWINDVNDDADWTFRSGSIGHGATTDNTLGTAAGFYAGMDDSQSSANDTVNNLLTPVFDLTSLTAPQLEFFYFIGNDATLTSKLIVDVFDGTIWDSAVATVNFTSAAWLKQVVDLTPYKSANSQIRFRGIETTDFNSDISIDDIKVQEAPSCGSPTVFTAIASTDSSITITWTSGGATNWNVQYDSTGFAIGTGRNIVAATNDTITINGLMANTAYDFYVQDSCGLGNVSSYTGPLNASTACSILALPYLETFEIASSTTLSCVTAQAGWALSAAGGFGNSTNSLTFNFYGVAGGTVSSAFSPQFQPVPANYQVSFDHAYATFATEIDSLKIYYSTDGGVTYTLLVGLDGGATGALNTGGASNPQFLPTASQWSNFAIALPIGTNSLRLDAISAFGNDLHIDNLNVDAAPSCAAISGVSLDTATTTSATLFWTANPNSTGTLVEYGLVGFTLGTGTVINSGNDTLTIPGLSASSCYDVYFTDSCAGGIASSVVGPITFCTACAAFTAPFYEGFETLGANIPNCWSSFSTTGELWRFTNSNIGHSAAAAATGSFFAAFDDSETPSTSDGVLETPVIDINALTTPTLSFKLWSDAEDGSGVAAGGVLNATIDIAVLNATGGWDTVFTNTGNTAGWEFFFIDLSTVTLGTTTQVRFVINEDHSGGFDDDISIDDISIDNRTPCFDPLNLAITNIGLNDVSLTWDSDTTVNTSIIEYGIQGFVLGSGTQLATSAGTGTVPGLTPGTCYDFYVLDSCSGGFTSWLGPITGCTTSPCVVTTNPTATNDSTACGGGNITLTATSGNAQPNVAWLQNGEVRDVSATYNDSIVATTNYVAADYQVVGAKVNVGPLPTALPGGFGNFNNGHWVTVYDTLMIDSITVRANGYVRGQVVVYDPDTSNGGRVIQTGDFFTTDSNVTADKQVPVGILLTPGVYYLNVDFDLATSIGALYRATGGASYPYIAPGLFSVDSVSFNGGQIRYYYLFDFLISGACLSTGTPVLGYVPGASAGFDVNVNVCENDSAFNLAGAIGNHASGGVWTDLSTTGGLTDSIYNATIAGAGGPFLFRYVVIGSGGCAADTALVTLTADTVSSAGISASAAYCTNNTSFVNLRPLLAGADGGGTWIDVDASGILIGGRIRPSNGTVGVFRFRYQIAASGACSATSATVTVTLSDPVEAGANAADTTCVNKGTLNLATYLSTNAAAGGTWKDVNNSGGLTGATFSPAGVTPNTTYAFRYVVAGPVGCGNDSATVSIFVCDDISLNEQALSSVALYPNPTSGVFFIEDADRSTQALTVEILSIDGKLLRKVEFNQNGKHEIDISAFAAGVYNVKVSTEKGIKVFRLITQD